LTKFCITNEYHGTIYVHNGAESNLNSFLYLKKKLAPKI
jgi:hypothetical protein